MPEAFYFGCVNKAGHYLHGQDLRTMYDPPPGLPWGYGLMDTGLLRNGKRPDVYDGKVYWTLGGRTDIWYAFVWWDNSVDKRGASNSGFYVKGFSVGQEKEAFEFAVGAFPSVVSRQRQPLVLQERVR